MDLWLPKFCMKSNTNLFGVLILLLILNLTSIALSEEVYNYHSGISIHFQGQSGQDWTQEYFYYNPAVDDEKVVYIKSNTKIVMSHNERNMRQTNTTDRFVYDIGVNGQDSIANSGDEGIIRYCVDRDLQLMKYYWSRTTDPDVLRYPAYEDPISFNEMQYEAGVPVVGTTGPNNYPITDRENYYYRGIIDPFGDEWHVFTFADDDEFLYENPDGPWYSSHWEKVTSDGKILFFVVNPKTPCIRFEVEENGQFYTTPPKAYWIPVVHEQTTYLTDNVDIVLTNIMSSASCYYRFYQGNPSGSYILYTPTAMRQSLNALTDDTPYVLEYYYQPSVTKRRMIIKNPSYPSDGEEHGNMLWKDESEFNAIKARLQTGNDKGYKEWYNLIKQNGTNSTDRNDHNEWDSKAGKGYRFATDGAFTNAFIASVEGWDYKCGSDTKSCAQYAKEMLLETSLNLDYLWLGDPANRPDPVPVLLYRGYRDAEIPISNALGYDLLIKHFKATQYPNGITPIEDYKIRDTLAKWNIFCLQQVGEFGYYGDKNHVEGMWGTARNMAALIISVAIPSYNTQYYGTSGFDGKQASYAWTPFRDHPVSWKDAFFAETNQLYSFPNMAHRFDEEIYESRQNGPIVLETTVTANGYTAGSGDWGNRAAYLQYGSMGIIFELCANVMKIKYNHTYSYWEQMFNKVTLGTVIGLRDNSTYQGPYILLVNERFAANNLAANAEAYMEQYDSDYYHSIWGQLTRNGAYGLILYHDDWRDFVTAGSNNSPVAVDDTFTVDQNTSENPCTVLNNDYDPDSDPITIISVIQPSNGSVVITQGDTCINYTPDSGYSGTDAFSYTLADNQNATATGYVTVTVNQTISQHVPDAQDDQYIVTQNSSNNYCPVLANDSDIDGDSLTIISVTQPASGQVTLINSNTAIEYTPTADFSGVDSFSYTITDGQSNSDTANVFLTVDSPVTFDACYQHSEIADFTNIDDFLQISTENWNLNGMTFNFWFKANDLTGTHYLFGHTVGSWSSRIQLYIENGSLHLGLGNSHALQTDQYSIESQQWYFVSFSFNGSVFNLWVNGYLIGSGDYAGLTQFNTYADIGNNGNIEYRNEAFSGIIDDIKIFSEVLNRSQITGFYNDGRNNGQIAHFMFNENFDTHDASVIKDDSGMNTTASAVNSPARGDAWAEEYFLRFNGGNQAVQIDCGTMNAQAGTIAMLVEAESTSSMQYLFGHAYNAANYINLYTLNGNLIAKLGGDGADINPVFQVNIATLNAGQIYHVALTWQNTQYAIYIDGQLYRSGSFSGLTELAATADIGNIGTAGSRDSGLGFEGIIDDVRIFSRALTADEILTLSNTQQVKENRILSFEVYVTDSEGARVLYTAAELNLPDGAAFDEGTQTIIWKPWYDQAGEHIITFPAKDGADQQSITISVQDVQLRDWYREFLNHQGLL